MKVRLNVSRAYKGGRCERPGDVVDVSEAEAGRLILSGQADPIDDKAGRKAAKAAERELATAGAAEAKDSLARVKRAVERREREADDAADTSAHEGE